MIQPCARSAAKFDFYTDHDLVVDDLCLAPRGPRGVRGVKWRVIKLVQTVIQNLVGFLIIQLGEENPKIDVEVDVAVAPVAAEQERPVRVSRREVLDPRAAVVDDERVRVQKEHPLIWSVSQRGPQGEAVVDGHPGSVPTYHALVAQVPMAVPPSVGFIRTASPRAAPPPRRRSSANSNGGAAWESTADRIARETAARDRGVGVDAQTLAARQTETSDLRKQVASALDEERKRVAKRANELASVEGELAKLATKEQADVATLRGRLEGLSKRLAAANADAKRKKDAYEAAAATASRLEQEKKELHEHLAMMVLSSEQRKEDKLKELLAAMGATDVS